MASSLWVNVQLMQVSAESPEKQNRGNSVIVIVFSRTKGIA